MKKTAILIGYSGLVGSSILKNLSKNDNYSKIKIFGRKEIEIENSKIEFHKTDFENLDEIKTQIKGNDLFSSLGTTRKKAGGKQNQYKIDFDYQYNFAKIASENNVENYFLVSSMGSNSNSGNFYLKMKGQLDDAVQKLSFKKIVIFRPSILDGDRKEKRPAEKIGLNFSRFFAKIFPFYRKYRPIHADIIAKAFIKLANKENIRDRVQIFTKEEIFGEAGFDYKVKTIKIS